MHEPPTAIIDDPPVRFAVEPPAERHRIGLIGCGNIAGIHLDAYRGAGFDVVAMCDVDQQQAVERRDEFYPDATVYGDFGVMLSSEDLDVIDVTTPPEPRVHIIRECLETGHHVLSQKPFVDDLEDGERLVSIAAERGLKLAVNQNARWSPDVGLARAAVEEGLLGDPYGFYATRCWDFNYIAGDSIPNRLLSHYMIHWFDMVRWLLPDACLRRVVTHTDASPSQAPEQPTFGQALVTFDDGRAVLTFDGNVRAGETYDFRLCGVDGTIESSGVDLDNRSVVLHRPSVQPVAARIHGDWFPDGFRGPMASLLRAIETDREPPHSGADNLETLRLVRSAIESAETGQPITIDDHT